ncbi:hypothetical protein JMUB6875_77060 [Nocardia sp. JMUB6875]
MLLAAFDAADPRQIDGVGGASSTTSKAAIVRASTEPGIDIEYAFAQVGIGDARVEWTSNCGNCATAVALYAVHHGLVPITADTTTVRMVNVNTRARLTGTIPTPGRVAPDEGLATVPGTDAPGVPVLLGFEDPAGSTTGALLPTGSAIDTLIGPTGTFEASLVDAGAPAVLLDAKAFDLDGSESLDRFSAAVPELTALRRQAALEMGLARPQDPTSHAGAQGRSRGVAGALSDHAGRRRCRRRLRPGRPYGVHARSASRDRTDLGGGTLRLGTPAGVLTVALEPGTPSASSTVVFERAARRIARAELQVPIPALL